MIRIYWWSIPIVRTKLSLVHCHGPVDVSLLCLCAEGGQQMESGLFGLCGGGNILQYLGPS